jgi:hypothetical protein
VLPAALWITRRVLNLVFTLGILWAIPSVVADYPTNTTSWVAGIVAAAVAIALLSRVFARIQRNRVPGALGRYGLHETLRLNVIPTLIADAFDFAVVAAALPYLLSRSDAYGILAGTLVLLGGGLLGLSVSEAVTEVWNHLPRWKRNLAWNLVGTLPMGILLTYAGLGLAPDPNGNASTFLWIAIFAIGIGRVVSATLRPAGRDIRDGLDVAADALTARTNVAPTLRDRERSRVLIRVAVIVAAAAVIMVIFLIASM